MPRLSDPMPAPPAQRHPVLRLLIILAWVVPAGPALTLVLYPFWSWWEATTGWESVGHSGPADWCYLATWAVLLAVACLVPPVARRMAG